MCQPGIVSHPRHLEQMRGNGSRSLPQRGVAPGQSVCRKQTQHTDTWFYRPEAHQCACPRHNLQRATFICLALCSIFTVAKGSLCRILQGPAWQLLGGFHVRSSQQLLRDSSVHLSSSSMTELLMCRYSSLARPLFWGKGWGGDSTLPFTGEIFYFKESTPPR